MHRFIRPVVAAVTAVVLAGMLPTQAKSPVPAPRRCPAFASGAAVLARYAEIGGPDHLGCLRSTRYGRAGLVTYEFQHGEILFAPSLGPDATMAGFADRRTGDVHVAWGPTRPYSYDEFKVRIAADGAVVYAGTFSPVDESDLSVEPDAGTVMLSTRGKRGTITIGVEGCYRSAFSTAACPRNWDAIALTLHV